MGKTCDGDGHRLNIAAAHGSFIAHMQIDPLSTPGVVPIDSLLSVNVSIFFSISFVPCLCYSVDYVYGDNESELIRFTAAFIPFHRSNINFYPQIHRFKPEKLECFEND